MKTVTIYANSSGYCLRQGQKVLFEGVSLKEILALVPELLQRGIRVRSALPGLNLKTA